MNGKYLDMVMTMAQQLDASQLELLIEKLVSHLDNHHSLGDGNTQDLLTHICNKHGMYTTMSDDESLTDWCTSQLEAHDYLVLSPDKLKELGSTHALLTHINETIDLDVPSVHRWAHGHLVSVWRTSTNDDYGNPKPWSERIK